MLKQSGKRVFNKSGGPNKPDLFSKALQTHQTGNLGKAEVLYRQILQSNPRHADALHLLGVIAYQTGKNDVAIEYIKKAISINPMASSYYSNMGSAFLNLKRIDEAVKCFEDAIRLNPVNPEAFNNLGNAFREMKRDEEAFEKYSRAIELKPDFAEAHNNLANLFKDLEEFAEAVNHYRQAIALKPDSSEAYFNYGNVLKEIGNLDEAVEQYMKAIRLKPDFAAVYNNLGNVLKEQRKYGEAVVHFQKAVALKPDFAEAYNNLGDAFRFQEKFDEAIECCLRAIELNPDFEWPYVNMGTVFLDQGRLREAIDYYEKAINMKPDCADAHYNKGLSLLMEGEFEEGWREYEWRLKNRKTVRAIGYSGSKAPQWDGSCFEGKTLLIKSEQGIGDMIQFVRYMPLIKARGGKVIFECHKVLMKLLQGFPGIDALIERDSPLQDGDYDLFIPLLSVPGILGAFPDNVAAHGPYIKADPNLIMKWKYKMNTGLFKVGLVWAGNPDHRNDRNRSCRLSDFAPLATIPDVVFFSLQKGAGTDQLNVPSDGMDIIALGDDLHDFADTAAAVANLDLLVSVDTSIVHLAGAMGKMVWTLLPFVPDWRWMLDRSDTPWYPSMRLFRQHSRGYWQSVMTDAAGQLTRLVGQTQE